MIKPIEELNFPEYATMSAATVSLPDMGDWTIVSTLKIDGQIRPDFSKDWEVLFQGHKYIMPKRKPAGKKEETSLDATVDLTFQHWAQYQLKRWYFFTIQTTEAGTVVADKYIASVILNLADFCNLFGQVLSYYFGDKITISLNPDWEYKIEPTRIDISYTYLWDVLAKLYELFAVRWQIETNGSSDKYIIKVGYPTTEQNHVFEYGFKGGLLKIERQVQSDEIRNMILGRGGEKNLPYRYFKKTDPNNPDFAEDPDWVTELENIYFSNLMGATFRSYVQGWKAQHISQYPGYSPVGEANAYAPWAYRKGYTDIKFDPVEYVADEIVANPETGDKMVQISPAYYPIVKQGSSIDKYGPLQGALDNNEDIYPTIQGVTVNPYGRIDEVVDVEPIVSDEIVDTTENDALESILKAPWPSTSELIGANARKEITLYGDWFVVPQGLTANFDEGEKSLKLTKDNLTIYYDFQNRHWTLGTVNTEFDYDAVVMESISVVLLDSSNNEIPASGIPTGKYRYKVTCKVHNTSASNLNLELSLKNPKLTSATLSETKGNTWCIWVKNIWQTSKLADETDAQYSERIWKPILGDRLGDEAKVMFTSGLLALSDDYEFTIVKLPEYDTSKSIDGVQSHWKITLAKSDAEQEATGLLIPSTKQQAKSGDYFLFIGIDMTHNYVVWNEIALDDYKKDVLADKSDIKPTYVVTPDRVRMNELGIFDFASSNSLMPGDTVRLRDSRFIEGDELLYLSSIKYSFREPTSEDNALNPDVEIILSDKYEVSVNPINNLQGEVSALAKQVGSLSNISQAVRSVGDKLYLSKIKDDRTPYDLSVGGKLRAEKEIQSKEFMSGMFGWQVDQKGNAEVESIKVRSFAEFAELIVNRQTTIEGDMIASDGDTIEEVIPHSDGTYTLKLHAEWEGYTTAQYEHNVCRGIYNDITSRLPAGAGQTSLHNATYYTSWFRILTVNPAANTVDVVLYPDDEVPAGKNFPPSPMMKFARWGNSGSPEDKQYAMRQSVIIISSTEGRIMKLINVTKPIIDIGNVAFIQGRLPDSITSRDSRLQEGDEGLYAKNIVSENLIQMDFLGRPTPTLVFVGPFDPNAEYLAGDTYDKDKGIYPRHIVEYCGCQWICSKSGTHEAPSWTSTDWTFYLGDKTFKVFFVGAPNVLKPRNFKFTLLIKASKGGQDVTSYILPQDVVWTRYSEDSDGNQRIASDNIWATSRGGSGMEITLTEADISAGSLGIPPVCIFIATVTLRDGTEEIVKSRNLGYS